ncbi:protein kinase domain-containing protein [Actinomadura terrae]|uniref:protein kinase domain-containing protein n=1 Tax=Actinomadura terrae TaxID=604353 RepID=UPI001FA706A7|nr:serine/threonine-protein kinase [Actinomadura terrae]
MTWDVPGYSVVRVLREGPAGRIAEAVRDGFGERVLILDGARIVPDEAWALTRLRDPHVLRVHEYVEQRQALVMDFVEGESLARQLAGGPMAPGAAFRVLRGCLLGLAAAHDAGLVHRDLSPANVVLTGGTCKLTGFAVEAPGTDGFAAPERRAGEFTAAGDLYSAAAIFYACLTGHAPGVVQLDLVPEPARGLLARGLAQNPMARPSSARAYAALVEAVARNQWEQPTPAQAVDPVPVPVPEDRPALVRPMAVTVALGLVCAGGGFGVGKAVGEDESKSKPKHAATPSSTPKAVPQGTGLARGRLAYAAGKQRLDVALTVTPAVVQAGGTVTVKMAERRRAGCPPVLKWRIGDGQSALFSYPRSAGLLPATRVGTPVKADVRRSQPKVSVKGCERTTIVHSTYTFTVSLAPGAYLLSPWSPPRAKAFGARAVSRGRLPVLTVR